MDKQELLSSITQLATQDAITKNDVIKAFENGKATKPGTLTREMGVSEVLYFIGGLIVFVSIAVREGTHFLNGQSIIVSC